MSNTGLGRLLPPWKDSKQTTPDETAIHGLNATSFPPPDPSEIVWSPNELGDPSHIPTELGRKPSLAETLRANSTFGLPSRNVSVSSDRRNDPLGLTVLYEPESSPSLDIIFVHGLGGTSRATWARGRDPEYFWPEKWLPLEPGIRMARILSFGYNATWASTGSAPITGITDFAKDLLYSMKFAKGKKLEELELGLRPIIFIVHSMGGLVVKQAYIHGQNDDQYSNIVSSISAILFLATPHRGSNLADVLNKILTVSLFNHSPKLYISELRVGSQTVAALNEQFRHIAPNLDILSFYETLQTSIGPKKMMVVEKESATLGYPKEISKPLVADHHTVCKFGSTQDDNYISVRNALKTLVSSIRSAGQSLFGDQGKTQLEQLQTLLAVSDAFNDDLEFFHSRWTPGTCDWIIFHPSFIHWMDEAEDSPTMLWLHALPASGKSVLSAFVTHKLLEESICVYYFFRFSDESKRSLSACLRSIAFQIAKQLPGFCRALKNMPSATKTLEKTDYKVIWERIFVQLLFKIRFSSTIYCVIDALDESDNPQQLVELMRSVSHSLTRIKVILVSRQTSGLITTFDRLSTVLSVAYLPLESTKRDIRLYVEREVEYLRAAPEFKARLVDKMVKCANGNFLWASLAMREVAECNTEEDVDETLGGIPGGMEQLYQRMERTIIASTKPRDRKLGQRILMWATCSRRPLVLSELAQALEPDFLPMVEMSLLINRVCGQFVIVDSATGRLVMVHQTARDHIVATDSELGVNVSEGHEKLLTKCLAVLEEKQHQPRDLHLQPGNRKDSLRGEFFYYAMTSWAYHLDKVSSDSDAPLLLLAKFLKGNHVLDWIVALAEARKLRVLVSSAKSMNLYARRKRGRNAVTHPMVHRLQELDLVESWATDLLKLIGKFGLHLTECPTSIYQEIPPFCPKTSMIYRQFEQFAPRPYSLAVKGLSKSTWDDGLAKISLQPAAQGLIIVCAGDHFAVLTGLGVITLYNSTTFETKHVLKHAEGVSAMSFSRGSHLLVTYGYWTTKIWSVDSGEVMHRIKNPIGSSALAIVFSTGDTQIVVGSTDRLLRVAQLTDQAPAWSILHGSLLKMATALDRPVNNVPWRMAFNSDATCVAVAYRGSPLCVWSLETATLVGRCMRSHEYAGNSWTVVDQMIWHPKSQEVLGLYMGGQVFRWNPYTNSQQELEAEGKLIACSPEGKFFTVGDTQGMIKLYSFHHFTLIYKLSCDHAINDICFSPDSKRLYDLRGPWCNVWEPNALLAGDENGEDSDLGSEAASIPSAIVSEASAEVRAQITAIAVQFGGRYHAVGNEHGVVSVIDSSDGEHVTSELWRSPLELPIEHLDWSSDGRFLASVEMAGRVVVKEIHAGSDRTWSVNQEFEATINVSPEGVQQVLLNGNGTIVLVKNGPSVTVQPVRSARSSREPLAITSPDTKWINHLTDPKLLLSFSTSHVRVYRWDDLCEIAVIDLERPPLLSELDLKVTRDIVQDRQHKQNAKIQRISRSHSGSHFLIHTTILTNGRRETVTLLFQTSYLSQLPTTPTAPTTPPISASTETNMTIPAEIQRQIEIPLGILSRQRLVFLDKSYWVCSWSLGSNFSPNQVQRHYFLPKDWLNMECLELCVLLPNGVFLMPNNGELAEITSTWLSHG
ncbi:Cytochrome cd1-nitrite reductase-like C-terminal heme d1 [Penicillium cf. griseofulvum]|uniref:Cytochrome cd1-nitrite reductase-like C-terminal heme d1 n=1 Tax=Penicillium cf. griseofulvum TaxID=2972120 RepID=A0A9W9IUQ7_9EURO|nr:Cytochrome cd1-nitrite reductase-like C-terminal heme d1 [Penicillium cf. griseofulvum]KAJ5429992.1 Cytochrome cd1-nitrite reductase-like C-terminal heme d1 [Penicillium cf. griseofulvum]